MQDEEVQLHIANAVRGVIVVGSYRQLPLSPTTSTVTAKRDEVDWTDLGSGATSTQLRRSQQPVSSTQKISQFVKMIL